IKRGPGVQNQGLPNQLVLTLCHVSYDSFDGSNNSYTADNSTQRNMENTQTVRSTFGHSITVFKNDHVGDKIARNGLYEKETLTLLLALLSRIDRPVVLDIGANIANHTLAFATCAQAVHAFEPIPLI